jgi:hypothetical protein
MRKEIALENAEIACVSLKEMGYGYDGVCGACKKIGLVSERHPCELVGTGYEDLTLRFLPCQYQIDGTGKRIGPVVMSCKRKVNQLLTSSG